MAAKLLLPCVLEATALAAALWAMGKPGGSTWPSQLPAVFPSFPQTSDGCFSQQLFPNPCWQPALQHLLGVPPHPLQLCPHTALELRVTFPNFRLFDFFLGFVLLKNDFFKSKLSKISLRCHIPPRVCMPSELSGDRTAPERPTFTVWEVLALPALVPPQPGIPVLVWSPVRTGDTYAAVRSSLWMVACVAWG